jgi:signal transduction histidine kinase
MNETQLKTRILRVLPDAYSSARILTVLDERGSPLFNPVPQRSLDWRRPFTALEIGELLPHWEVVTYLTDPQALTSQARSTTWIVWMLILLLFISIAAGGTLILRNVSSQVRLAQQKTTFVANVSHELKTPLTSIRLFTELLREKRQPDEARQGQYLDLMISETERLTRLINNVLDFSRMAEGKKQYTMKIVDAISLCREMVEKQRIHLELNGFSLTFTAELQSVMVKADEEALRQVLINLLSNAEKYSPEKKEIEVEIEIGRERGLVFIRVKDRGIGIPASESERIFKEFYRVDDSLTSRVKGTGLGLTIARRIVRDHGGDLAYLPREKGGSIFQIQLPIAEVQRSEFSNGVKDEGKDIDR